MAIWKTHFDAGFIISKQCIHTHIYILHWIVNARQHHTNKFKTFFSSFHSWDKKKAKKIYMNEHV